MIRLDITEQWETLRGDPPTLQHYILAVYGADKTELAPFPYRKLVAPSGATIGLIDTYTYPRVTLEEGHTYLELSDVLIAVPERADLREALAALAHEQWSGWMRWMFDKGAFNPDGTWTMPAELVKRWQRQMSTGYADLPDMEKASDRTEADKVLALLDGVTTNNRV